MNKVFLSVPVKRAGICYPWEEKKVVFVAGTYAMLCWLELMTASSEFEFAVGTGMEAYLRATCERRSKCSRITLRPSYSAASTNTPAHEPSMPARKQGH
jgi:hypothetical protein